MSYLDWAIIIAYLSFMIFDGIRMTKHSKSVEGYFLANKSLPWWAVGLSVMATQMSAITLVGTTGQGYSDGMRFIQFYFGLPLAMIVLCITVVKFFHNANVYTAYEYLEQRFDVRVRTLTSFFFLISRGLAAGVVVAAPSIILSLVLGWNLTYTIFAIGMTTTIYTMFGGVQAVTWTDVKQMFVIFFGLFVCIFVIVSKFPEGVGATEGLHLASAVNKLTTVDFKFDVTEQYTFWSGLIGGMFLAMAYFGCDQTQVQRFLTAKSVDEGRTSLLMSAFLKIPMQFFILLIGIMVFVFYQFQKPPMIFIAKDAEKAAQMQEYKGIEENYSKAFENRKEAATEFLKTDSPEAKQKYVDAHKQFEATRKDAVDLVKKR
ncbi:MAG: sodium/solute symporter [Blastocatellia bacterium]|nr:sodium/solute symporter [Blastocatellia bacterium]